MNQVLLIAALLISTVFAQNASAKSSKGDFKRFCQIFVSEKSPLDTDLYYYGYLYGAVNMAKMVHLSNGKEITERKTKFMAHDVCKEALKDKELVKEIGFLDTLLIKAYELVLKQ